MFPWLSTGEVNQITGKKKKICLHIVMYQPKIYILFLHIQAQKPLCLNKVTEWKEKVDKEE